MMCAWCNRVIKGTPIIMDAGTRREAGYCSDDCIEESIAADMQNAENESEPTREDDDRDALNERREFLRDQLFGPEEDEPDPEEDSDDFPMSLEYDEE